MKNMRTLKAQSRKYWMGLALGMVLWAPTFTWAQSTNSVNLTIANDMFLKQSDGTSNIDLLVEIRKVRPALTGMAIEIQAVRVEAKSGLGGAQIFLKINNQANATAVVETDPAQYNIDGPTAYQSFELKNMDRASIRSAVLALQNAIKIRAIEVTLGAAQEPAVMGRYAQNAAAVVGGGSGDEDTRPTEQALSEILGTYYGADEASILAQQQAAAESAAKAEAARAADAQSIEIRNWISNGTAQARIGDEYTIRNKLSEAQNYYNNQRWTGEPIVLENEIISYINTLQSILSAKQDEVLRIAQEERARKEAQRRAIEAARPKPNYANPTQCLKAKKKKSIGNKKDFCIGEYLPGLYPQYNAPQIIDVDKRSNELIIVFDHSPQTMRYPVDSLPNK